MEEETTPNATLPQRDEQMASAFVDGLKLLKATGSSAGPEGWLTLAQTPTLALALARTRTRTRTLTLT